MKSLQTNTCILRLRIFAGGDSFAGTTPNT